MSSPIIHIPSDIEISEILVRFIFTSDFKNKNIEVSRINHGDIFLDTRWSGISLQRYRYCIENECKKLANSIDGKQYVGFVIFKKEDFIKIYSLHKEEREEFEAEIVYTPLDENNEIILDKNSIFSDTPGNPSHADLYYLNPAIKNDETPNTAIRQFSRKLVQASRIIIDYPSSNVLFELERFY